MVPPISRVRRICGQEPFPLYGSSQALMRSIWRAAAVHPHHAEEIADTFLTLFCRKLKSRPKGLTINAAMGPIFPLNLV
jgi:hypothetical protein